MDKYYYSDAVYELELNLHTVRRELISMLEVFEETDCTVCFQIKCKCVKIRNSSGTSSGKSLSSGNGAFTNGNKDQNLTELIPEDGSTEPSSPEKETTIKNIEAWIEASSNVEEDKTVSISISRATSVRPEKNTQIQNIVSRTNAVEAFFKYFKVPATSTNLAHVTYVPAKLAAACSKPAKKNYTYF